MRKIYFIRHGQPDFPDVGRWCIGRTDLPLSDEGRAEGARLQKKMMSLPVTAVYCSYLKRSIETASFLSDTPVIWPGLEEQYAGKWDGLPFSEIQQKWPEIYALRKEDPSLQPPGAETIVSAVKRFSKAVSEILSDSEGDIAIVAHKTVLQLFFCSIHGQDFSEKNTYQLPFTSITTVEIRKEDCYETNVSGNHQSP